MITEIELLAIWLYILLDPIRAITELSMYLGMKTVGAI